jgi:hypothetical protein
MGAGTVKHYPAVFTVNAVYEEPVRFNMTFPPSIVFPMQGVIFVFGEQGLFVYKHSHYFGEFVHVLVAFLH